MATLRNVSKKHHKRINNPFPSTPKSLPLLSGALFSRLEHTSGSSAFGIGSDFQLLWSSQNGGSLSISHNSMPGKAIFSTKPGKAFVSAALAETEAEESRGSFAIKDGKVHFVCRHQSVDEIRVANQMEELYEAFDRDPSRESNLEATQFPAVIVKGWVFSSKKAEKYINGDLDPPVVKMHTYGKLGKVSVVAKYWVLFDQKNHSQVGFQVKFGPPNWRLSISSPTRKIKSLRKKFRLQFQYLSRSQGFSLLMNEVDEFRDRASEFLNFNRVVVTYSSERDEKFFGFGEQFSHMEFKGRRVPIFVQEQGIGRGDQPITFAANLVSYR